MLRPRDFRFVPRSGNPFRFESRSVVIGGVRLSRERCLRPTMVHGSPAPGTASVFAPLPTHGAFRYVGHDVEPGALCVTHGEDGWGGAVPERYDSRAVIFSIETLRRYAADLGMPDPKPFLDRAWLMPPDPRFAPKVQILLQEAEVLAPATPARHVEEAALDLVLSAVLRRARERSPRVSFAGRRRVLKRAIEYAFDHLSDPPRVVDLCRATEVSARTLEYVFRETYDVTVSTFLEAARLTRVRLDLARAASEGGNVTQIAIRWGFHDLGGFARAYARRYAESPAVTLRRGLSSKA